MRGNVELCVRHLEDWGVQESYTGNTAYVRRLEDAVVQCFEVVPDDDLADAGDAIEKLATRPYNEHVVLRHGRWVCARRFHKVGDAGVPGRGVHFDVIMVHDELDDALCGVVVRARDDFFDLSDDARVGLGRPVSPVLSAAKELGAAFLVRLGLVKIGDHGLGLEQANKVAKGGGYHGVGLLDTSQDRGRECLGGGLRDRGVRRAELTTRVTALDIRIFVGDGDIERVLAISEKTRDGTCRRLHPRRGH